MKELFQDKMLSNTEIKNGGFFPRWPTNGTRFLGFAGKQSKMGDRSL